MSINAHGLSRQIRERIVQLAKSGLYDEHYLANRFGVTDEAIRDICTQMGNFVCKRTVFDIDENGNHQDGHEI